MAKNLNLTDVERLMLANQYEILGLLKKDTAFSQLAAALRDGHASIYSQRIRNIGLLPVLADEQVDLVFNILRIYCDLRDSYERLGSIDGVTDHEVRFPGFDGNNESELLHFAAALSADGSFTTTIGDEPLNSHIQMVDVYERMIDRWRELGSPNFPYSSQTILAILAAQVHPSNRK